MRGGDGEVIRHCEDGWDTICKCKLKKFYIPIGR